MRTSNPPSGWSRLAGALLFAFLALLSSVAPAADRSPLIEVIAVPIGRPVWMPVDFHMFSAPIGTADSGYVEFVETMAALLPPPDHALDPHFGIGPGAAHAGPYGTELGESVRRLHLRDRILYESSDFTQGNGVWLVWMNIPASGASGASPDFPVGRVIPNELFPIRVAGTDIRNGRKYSVLGEFEVPPLDAATDPRFAGMDGHSHFPIFFADSADFGPPGTPLRGSYRYLVTMLDQSGQGWFVHAHFAILR